MRRLAHALSHASGAALRGLPVSRLQLGIAVLGYGTAATFLVAVVAADVAIGRSVPPSHQSALRLSLLTVAVAIAAIFSVAVVGRFAGRYVAVLAAARRSEEAQRGEIRLRTLNQLARAVASKLDLPSLTGLVLGELIALLDCARCSVSEYDPAAGTLRVLASHRADGSADVPADTSLPVTGSLIGQVAPRGEAVVLSDTTTVPLTEQGRHALAGLAAAVGVPIVVGDRVWGVLTAAFATRDEVTSAHVELLTAASSHVAIAIRNTELYAELRNALDQLRAAQEQMVQQERLRALGQMASGIAHDLNNALDPVTGFSELLLTAPTALTESDASRRYLELIHTGARDAASVVKRLREFYRPRDAAEPHAPLDLTRLAAQVIDLTQPKWKDQVELRGHTIAVERDLQPVPLVAGDEAALREALTNLDFNAADAMPTGGRLTMRTYATGSPARDRRVVVEVSDTGTGMPDDVRRRCLEPFFTTKAERGSGLGLSMVHGIAQRHGGELDIQSAPLRGTTVRVILPPFTADHSVEQASSTLGVRGEAPAAARALTILVVDDDPTVRAVTREQLLGDGHSLVEASSGAEALERFSERCFDAVITDRAMAGMSGDDLALALKRRAPTVPVILLTGYGDLMNAASERPRGVDAVVGKPATRESLRRALDSCSSARGAVGPAPRA